MPPALLTLLALGLVASAARPMRPSAPAAGLLGLLPLLVLLGRPPEVSFAGRVWRAAVYGAFSGLDPERRELRAAARTASTEPERRRAFAMWRAYGVPGSDLASPAP